MNLTAQSVPERQGEMKKDEQGRLILINPEGKAYSIDDGLSTIWTLADGQASIKEMTEKIIQQNPNNDADQIQSVIESSLLKLNSVQLATWN